jgi:TatD DNase family protein
LVGCFNELFEIKRRIKSTQLWIIHGFRGRSELVNQALRLDFALSFGMHFNPESVRVTASEKLCIETDENTIDIADLYQQIAIVKGCKASDLSAGSKLLAIGNENKS